MQAVLALRRAGGIATGLGKGVLLFALRRARTVQRTLFSSSTVSTQLALLAINFCFLYAGASRFGTLCASDSFSLRWSSVLHDAGAVRRRCSPPVHAVVWSACAFMCEVVLVKDYPYLRAKRSRRVQLCSRQTAM